MKRISARRIQRQQDQAYAEINRRLEEVRAQEVRVAAQVTAVNFVTRCFDKMFGSVDVTRLDFTSRMDHTK